MGADLRRLIGKTWRPSAAISLSPAVAERERFELSMGQ